MFAMFSSVAFLPAIRSAGSPPGTTMKIANVMKLMIVRTISAPRSLRIANAAIA
jgi:hypothetical protein